MAFMGNKTEENSEETSDDVESSQKESEIDNSVEKRESPDHINVSEGKEASEAENAVHVEAEETTSREVNEEHQVEVGEHTEPADGTTTQNLDQEKDEDQLPEMPVELPESPVQKFESLDSVDGSQEKEIAEVGTSESPVSMQPMAPDLADDVVEGSTSEPGESHTISDVHENIQVETKDENTEETVQIEERGDRFSSVQPEESSDTEKTDETSTHVLHSVAPETTDNIDQSHNEHLSGATPPNDLVLHENERNLESSDAVSDLVSHENETTIEENETDHIANNVETDMKEQHLSSVGDMHDSDSAVELDRVKRDMKMMEAALQGAARQAQVLHLLHVGLGSSCLLSMKNMFTWPLGSIIMVQKFYLASQLLFFSSGLSLSN